MSARHLMGRAVLVSALTVTLVPMLGANPASACSCIGGTDQEHFDRVDVVFEGTRDAAAETVRSAERVFVFNASTIHKGQPGTPLKVSSRTQSTACGLQLTGSGPFLVFAYRSARADAPAELSTGSCTGTRKLEADEKPAFEISPVAAAGNFPQAAEASDDGSEWAPVTLGVAALVAAAMLATGWAVRRRRS